MDDASRSQELVRLTSLRAFAALAVFCFHLQAQLGWKPLTRLTDRGGVGVPFFFILSGFVLAWSAPAIVTARSFYWRRFARIYPAHLVMSVIVLAYLLLHQTSTLSIANILLPLFLLQAWSGVSGDVFGLNGPSWSLSCEAFFYACFPMALDKMRKRSNPWLLAVPVAVLGLGFQLACSRGLPAALDSFPLARLGEFLLGIAASLGVRKAGRIVSMRIAIAATASVWIVTDFGLHWTEGVDICLVPCFVLLIISAAQADVRLRPGLLTQDWLRYLGQISFCFYLVHLFVLGRLVTGAGHRSTSTAVPLLILTLAACTAAAMLLHHAVELPVQRRLTRKRLSPTRV